MFQGTADVEWATKRWANAQLMKVVIVPGNVTALSKALACSQPNDLECLTEVCQFQCVEVLWWSPAL